MLSLVKMRYGITQKMCRSVLKNGVHNTSTCYNVQYQKISILPPQKGLEFPGGGGCVRPKNVKKCMLIGNSRRVWGESLEKIPSLGEVWMFSGITQCMHVTCYKCSTKRKQCLCVILYEMYLSPNI